MIPLIQILIILKLETTVVRMLILLFQWKNSGFKRFKESFTGGGLDVGSKSWTQWLGYKQEEINFNILTANGYGGELNATLDDNGSISNLSLVYSGRNYKVVMSF